MLEDYIDLTDYLENGYKVVVLFTAPSWCRPCQQFEPHWKSASQKVDNVVFVRVDFGPDPAAVTEHWAGKMFNIMSVPTVLFFADDESDPVVVKSRAVVPLVKELETLA